MHRFDNCDELCGAWELLLGKLETASAGKGRGKCYGISRGEGPGKGGKGAGGRAGFTGSAPDFFLFFLNPMTSPSWEGGLNSIEPYRKKPQNYMQNIG